MRILGVDPAGHAPLARTCRWRYGVLVEDIEVDGFHCESYGITVTDARTGQGESVRHITVCGTEALALVELLARNTVSPVSLQDVIEDWLGR